MADYSTICGYVSPTGSDAKPPMSFPSLANSPPSSPPLSITPAVSGGVGNHEPNSLHRDHAIRSLTEAVHSLHNMSITRLPSTSISDANAIISDAEVRAFMTASSTAAPTNHNATDAGWPSANENASTPSSSVQKSCANEEEGERQEAKFSPKHAAYSSPNLLLTQPAIDALVLRNTAGKVAERRREGVTRSWAEIGGRTSPGVARRVSQEAGNELIGQRLAGAASNDSMGLAQYPHGAACPTGPFLSAPQAPGVAMTEIALSDGCSTLCAHRRRMGEEDNATTDDRETDEESERIVNQLSANRRSVIRDISLSPSAGSCRTGSSSGITGGLEDYLFKPSALDLGGAGGDEDEDRLSLPGTGRLAHCGLVLPSVEDGLSSGANSEVNSPKISPRVSRRSRASANVHSGSSSTASGSSGLLNQGIIRAITDDIRDIKRAIAENVELPHVQPSSISTTPGPLGNKDLRDLVRPPPPTPPPPPLSLPSGAGVEEKEDDLEDDDDGKRNGQRRVDSRTASSEDSSVWTKRCSSSASSTPHHGEPASPLGPSSPTQETPRTRDGIRVPGLQPYPPPANAARPQQSRGRVTSVSSRSGRSHNLQNSSRPAEKLEAQHWTFPAVSHTVYSSSSSASSESSSKSDDEEDDEEEDRGVSVEEEQHNHYFMRRRREDRRCGRAEGGEGGGGGGSHPLDADYESDDDTEKLLTKQYTRNERVEIPELQAEKENQEEKKRRGREVAVRHPDNPSVLIEGVLFRARYLGSTQLVTEGQPSKATRMVQAQEAVGRIKAPEGESQPSTDVDLFVSTEKIMVLNTNLKEIMMDHSLKTISYIADIGDVLVIMARRRLVPMNSPTHDESRLGGGGLARQQIKVICHVFESEEAQLIAQSIGHAFQVAYMEFLKANGIEDPSVFKEMDYQEVLNQQEIFGEELALFSDKGMQKEVIIPKQKGEPLGIVIVESGWGSMIPTVVLANMKPTGPAARCGQLNIGDQIIAVNGHSLVGLPLAQCQQRVKGSRKCGSVQLSLVSCSPVVQVRIKRPDLKYQLGFSLQNGVICSLLRGGIAERGGVRVGHRIIEINGESVVGVAHERMVNMLSTCVGEIRMRTMPTCIFRLMTGQEEPVYI